jgi:hypothetical protein
MFGMWTLLINHILKAFLDVAPSVENRSNDGKLDHTEKGGQNWAKRLDLTKEIRFPDSIQKTKEPKWQEKDIYCAAFLGIFVFE